MQCLSDFDCAVNPDFLFFGGPAATAVRRGITMNPKFCLFVLALLGLACTSRSREPRSREPRSRESHPSSPRRPARDGIWALVPADTDWLLMVAPGALPREVTARLPALLEAGPCREGPPRAVLFLHGARAQAEPFTARVRLFDGARAGCVPDAVGFHRGHPVLGMHRNEGRPAVWEVWSPRAWVRAPVERAQYLTDRIADPDAGEAVEPVRLRRAVAPWRPGVEGEPAVALWFVRTPRVERFLGPLFPEAPLRGSLLFFFSDGWARLRVHLEFADTATAEQAVTALRDGLISAIESGNYPRLDWKAALEPLVVHPEGSLLWVQWSMPLARALPLFSAVAQEVDP
jgi:hypothetical protein